MKGLVMSCYHPMVLIKTSDMTDPSQRKIVERLRLGHAHDKKYKSMNTILIPREIALGEGIDLRKNRAIIVPCGHCIGCRLDYSKAWAERCVHESSQHQYNYFLTLTYDDDHLPRSDSSGLPTLIHDEISSFMKKLRQKFKRELNFDGIRFFGCGEYGTKGDRGINPHYHIILFNCPIPDLQERHPIKVDGQLKWIFQYSDDGEKLLFSKLVASCWTDENGQYKGTAQLGQVTYESAAYVARYCMKKKGEVGCNDWKLYSKLGLEPQHIRMSRRPGIGYDWYDEHFEQIYEDDGYVFKRCDKAIQIKPGRYCDRLLKDRDEQAFYELKEKRHEDYYNRIDSIQHSGIDIVRNNAAKELSIEQSIKLLKRN